MSFNVHIKVILIDFIVLTLVESSIKHSRVAVVIIVVVAVVVVN